MRWYAQPRWSRGFWTVVEHCIGRQLGSAREAIGVEFNVIEGFFRDDPEWGSIVPPPWWPDILVNQGFHAGDFPWRVVRAGSKLRFMPK